MSVNLRTVPESAYNFKHNVTEKKHLIDVLNYDFGLNLTVDNVSFSEVKALDNGLEENAVKGGVKLPEINNELQANTEVLLTYDDSAKGLLYKRIHYHRNHLGNQFYLIYGKTRPTNLPVINWEDENVHDTHKEKVIDWIVKMIPCRKTSIIDVLFNKEFKAITIKANPLSLMFTGEVTLYLEDSSKTSHGWIALYGADPL